MKYLALAATSCLLLLSLVHSQSAGTPSARIGSQTLLSPQQRLDMLRSRHLVSQNSGPLAEGEAMPPQSEAPNKLTERQLREAPMQNFYRHPISDPGQLVRGQQETTSIRFLDAVVIDDGSGQNAAIYP